MSFEVSPCVGLTVPDPGEASRFYQEKVGLKLVGLRDGIELTGGGLRFFLDPGHTRDPVLELLTPDLPAARNRLRSLGMEEIRWRGPGQANIFVDPFGYRWNVYETDDLPAPFSLDQPKPSPVLAKISLPSPHPLKTSDFYATLLSQPKSHTPEAWIVEGRHVRLLVADRQPYQPEFFLDPGFDLSVIDPDALGENPVAVDPYGVRWRSGPVNLSDTAVVQTSTRP